MGGEEFFDSSIGDKVIASIQSNAMTPSVASDFVKDLAARRAEFLGIVHSTIKGLEQLHVSAPSLPAGAAEVAFLIPREIFHNHLGAFAKELTFISHLMQHINEGVTGESQPIVLEGLSSSIPTIGLGVGLKAIEMLATIVNKFLDAWEKIQRIRKIRGEIEEMGITGPPIDHLTEQITTTINEVVEESTHIILINYKGESGRKNELQNALRQDTHRLFGQIERGLTIEVRTADTPDAEADEENLRRLESVAALGREMHFPSIAPAPMLLSSGELLEGEILSVKRSKRTTTQQVTTSKKETSKSGKNDTKEPV